MCKENRKTKSSHRVYYCNKDCDIEFLKIDLTVIEDILITGERIFRYTITNVGSKDIYGTVIIESKLFTKIREVDVLLKENENITIERITLDLEGETARAFFKIKDIWIHSDLINLDNGSSLTNNLSLASNQNDNISLLQDLPECYLVGYISKIQIPSTYVVYLRVSNSSNVDATNVVITINFDESMTNPVVLNFNGSVYSGYTRVGQKLIFDSRTIVANQVLVYRITLDSLNSPYPITMELNITTDTPNGFKDMNPNFNFCNLFN